MFKRLFWLLLGAVIAFWIFKNDPELIFLVKFRQWLLDLLHEFQDESTSDIVKNFISNLLED